MNRDKKREDEMLKRRSCFRMLDHLARALKRLQVVLLVPVSPGSGIFRNLLELFVFAGHRQTCIWALLPPSRP